MLTDLVKDYYSKAHFDLSSFPRREFAFEHWNSTGPSDRNRSFENEQQLREALEIITPKAVFSSNALYLDPGHPDKDKKDLKSVDLAFDLDYTDIPQERLSSDFWTNIQQIANETTKLIKEILPTLGISEEDILITFSGGKGFHVRVINNKYSNLSKGERHQIQEFILGKGLQPTHYIGFKRKYRQQPQISWGKKEHGWPGHFSKAASEYLGTIIDSDMATAYTFIDTNWPYHEKGENKGKKKKCHKGTVNQIIQVIKDNPKIRNGGNIQKIFIKKTHSDYVIDSITQWARLHHGATIDPSVTQDLRRILRLPGSLHGKTGLPCMVIEVSDLMDVATIKEKHKKYIGTDEIEINLTHPIQTVYGPYDKGTHVLPRYLALCVLCAQANE